VSGFSGMELSRLIARHPSFILSAAVSDRWQRTPLGTHMRLPEPVASLRVAPMSDAVAAASQGQVALLCTPNEVSARLAPELIARGVRVVDLSGAFRLVDPAAYPRWYRFSHPAPELLGEARYSIPELPAAAGAAPGAREARLIANPGCYATAAILALAPLVATGSALPAPLFVDGKSGVTGAGRKVEERLLFTEVDENLAPYRAGDHQHTPEIEQALSRIGGSRAEVTFVPHLLPVRRGLLVTAFARLAPQAVPESLPSLFERFYENAALIEVTTPERVTLADVTGTACARVGVRADGERGTILAIAALDNLLKGAASQALQNLCDMTGVPLGVL
jgi:N-acetyl-gamma-glutamyl-phosphate reductase